MSSEIRQIEHKYPEQFRILQCGYISTLLTNLSQSKTTQPQFNILLQKIYYELMVQVLNSEWPQKEVNVPTRMSDQHPDCNLKSRVFDDAQRAVCVDVARAGMFPNQIVFDLLNHFAQPEGVRQDHLFASRVTNSNGEVTHTDLASSKIGGDINGAFVFLPDPMGATGGSMCEVIEYYKSEVSGAAKKFICMHLIITPEYIKKMHETHPDVMVYAARVDRGLSDTRVLSAIPGTHWEQEKGLNETHYIVPGAGGVGELINNSYA